jgi:hypothetical protein
MEDRSLDFCVIDLEGGNGSNGLSLVTETASWSPGWYMGSLIKRDGSVVRLRLMIQP